MTKYANGEENRCLVCGTPDSDKAMVFRKTDWCSDDHRKVITNEITPEMDPASHAAMRDGISIRFMSSGPRAPEMPDPRPPSRSPRVDPKLDISDRWYPR